MSWRTQCFMESFEDLMPKVGCDDFDGPLILQFIDDESQTNLFFIQRDPLSMEWEVKDGSPRIEQVYWKGEIRTWPALVSKLIRFGGNMKPKDTEGVQ
jgi:hypothetical protein